jgi:predicted Zn-dependent peptidase
MKMENYKLPSSDEFWPQKFLPKQNVFGCKALDKPMLAMGFEGPSLYTKEFVCANFVKFAFGDSTANDYMKSVVYNFPSIDTCNCMYFPYGNSGITAFSGTCPNESTQGWVDAVFNGLLCMVDNRYKETMFNMSKNVFKYAMTNGMSNTRAIADECGINLLLNGRMKSLDEWYKLIDSITVKDVEDYVHKYFLDNINPSFVLISNK